MRTARSECLDWMLILNQQHLARALEVFVTHYNEHRPHRALSLVPPDLVEQYAVTQSTTVVRMSVAVFPELVIGRRRNRKIAAEDQVLQ